MVFSGAAVAWYRLPSGNVTRLAGSAPRGSRVRGHDPVYGQDDLLAQLHGARGRVGTDPYMVKMT